MKNKNYGSINVANDAQMVQEGLRQPHLWNLKGVYSQKTKEEKEELKQAKAKNKQKLANANLNGQQRKNQNKELLSSPYVQVKVHLVNETKSNKFKTTYTSWCRLPKVPEFVAQIAKLGKIKEVRINGVKTEAL